MASSNRVDVLIVGAGLSGIGMACHLRRHCPELSFLILEGRSQLGGTWDLFRYPGVRSDSDMFTYAYNFRPWLGDETVLDGARIAEYLDDTADAFDLKPHMLFQRKVVQADWCSANRQWFVQAKHASTGAVEQYSARFLVCCTGYFNYEQGHVPEFSGRQAFQGQWVHPQQWDANVQYAGKRVVVVGSGATAMTLVPALAEQAAHVTLLQRSPTYVASVPRATGGFSALRCFLSEQSVFRLVRKRNLLLQRWLVRLSKRYPSWVRWFLLRRVRQQVGAHVDMKHFTPSYNPWAQRLCVVPDGDLFHALRMGKASVVTDHIDAFDATGVRLKSGQHVAADVVVTATGLELLALGGMKLVVDGRDIDPGQTTAYKSVMLGDVPNFGVLFGYTNASWTLKVDLAAEYLCRVLKHMHQCGHSLVIPSMQGVPQGQKPLFDLDAGYMKRAADRFPKQGEHFPWQVVHDVEYDHNMLLKSSVEDGVLVFS